jgi:uncharacterized protein YbjQ (UPF0145 family)
MTPERRDRPWGSVLSVAGFAALRSVGFEPVGQVFGAAVYPLYATAGVSCPGVAGRDARPGASRQASGTGATVVSGQGIPGPATRIAQALTDGRRTAIDRMAAECSALDGHGVVGATVQVRQIPAEVLTTAAVEFTVMGTAVLARGCPPLARPFTSDLSGPDFAKIVLAGWVPAGIALGIAVAARHDELLAGDSARWGRGNMEVPAYTELMIKVRQQARRQLEQEVGDLGADGVVVSAMTLSVHADACEAHPGGTDHFAESVITGTVLVRFAGQQAPAAQRSVVVRSLGDLR